MSGTTDAPAAPGPAGAPEPASPRQPVLLVRFGELFLKGENRYLFLASLEHNLKRALRRFPGLAVEPHHGRFVVRAADPAADLRAALERAARVFGVTSVSLGASVARDLEAMKQAGAELASAAAAAGARSFKVHARRSDKRFTPASPEINDVVGRAAQSASGLRVDVHAPDVTLAIEVAPQFVILAAETRRGPGGLPVGVSGNVTLLLSGGIDSPVAGYLAQKRGCRVNAVYFHSFPYTGAGARQKVVDLAAALGQAQGGIRLTVLPFTAIQEALRDGANPRLLVLLYRRAMMRMACRVASEAGAGALVTGENLGQVASQTLENLACIEDAADRPVLRPVIAYDKSEIVALARQTGTFEISVRPYEDCCSLFVPRHPATKGRVGDVRAAEDAVPLADLMEQALAAREIVDLED
jgi:thiamine biosynthesis protein ThiI